MLLNKDLESALSFWRCIELIQNVNSLQEMKQLKVGEMCEFGGGYGVCVNGMVYPLNLIMWVNFDNVQ